MSLCLKRLSDDWQKHYRHPILLVESFVDRQLFRATAYKAYGWQALGYSSGFKRVAEDFYQRHGRPKELWVKELHPRAWQWLRAKQWPAHLVAYEKATDRKSTRLNSSHTVISYAVFCLKKKKKKIHKHPTTTTTPTYTHQYALI